MKAMKGLAVILTILALYGLGSGLIGCKKKQDSNNQTSSGGGAPPPSPAPGVQVLTVTKSGTGGGVVVSTPSGISCGVNCTKSYNQGTVVTLTTGSVTSGSVFSGWTGDCSGMGACVVTMSASKNVTAQFGTAPLPVNVTLMGTGIGTVTSSPAGISCGLNCGANFSAGSNVTLTAAPQNAFSTFAGWAGACSGTGVCSVTIDSAKNVTATFNKVDLNGTWVGTTNQGLNMQFIVDTNKVSVYGTTFTFSGGGCSFSGWSTTSFGAGGGISIGTDYSFSDLPDPTFGISGAFSSGSAASGTFVLVSDDCGSQNTYTWTAQKASSLSSSSLHGHGIPPAGKYSGRH